MNDLSEIEGPLREQLRIAETEEARLRAEAEEVAQSYRQRVGAARMTRQRIERTLNYLTTGSATGETTSRSRDKGKTVSEASVERVLTALKAVDGDATVPELVREGGLSMANDTIQAALNVLRERELIRLAGKRRSRHDQREHGQPARAWAVMRND